MARIRPHRPNAITREASAGEASAAETNLRDVLPTPRMPSIRGTRSVTAMLPNGGVAWLSIDPTPASAGEVNRLRRAIQQADVHHAAGLSDDKVAIRRLSKQVTADFEQLGKRRNKRSRKLGKRVLDGDEKNARQLATRFARHELEAGKQRADERAFVRRQQRRHLWDSILLASSAPLFAAYGQEGDPLAEHNLALTLSLGVWLVGDELSDLLSGRRGVRGAATIRDVDFWSYVAPLGNMLTGWWLFEGRQHERFVTGIVDSDFELVVPPPQTALSVAEPPGELVAVDVIRPSRITYRAQIDLAPSLAPGHVDDFRAFTHVPAVATLVSSAWDVAIQERGYRVREVMAEVELGFLTITVVIEGLGPLLAVDTLPKPRVAWMVDVRDPKR